MYWDLQRVAAVVVDQGEAVVVHMAAWEDELHRDLQKPVLRPLDPMEDEYQVGQRERSW